MLTYLKLVLTMTFWGGTFIAGRLLHEMGAVSGAFLRFVVAVVFMLVLAWRMEGGLHKLTRQQFVLVCLLGLTGVFLYNIFFLAGLQTVAAGRASLIIASIPAFIAIFSTLVFKEPFTKLKGLGVALSITGALTVISHGDLSALTTEFGMGEAAIFGCVISWVAYSLIGKMAMAGLSPVAAVAWSCVTGVIMLFPLALYYGLWSEIQNASLLQWGAVSYLGVFGTGVGFSWYYAGISKLGAARAGVFINLVPVNAVTMGWLFLDEPVGMSLIAGAALIIVGVYLVNRQGSPAKASPAPLPDA